MKTLIYVLSMTVMLLCRAGAAGAYQADGKLTDVDPNGIITIDRRDYAVDSAIRILDRRGRNISIEYLKLPANVHFEYEYKDGEAVIKLIQEKEVPKVETLR